ncbi:MAG: hypothetical protein OXF00_07875, partial [bacterium]|nr:hypothetical protein [bacterium]
MALLAGALVWAAPGSEAQTNQAPVASAAVDDGDNAGTPPTYNPSRADGGDANVTVNLDGEGSFDVDDGDNSELCADCKYKWEIETGPYDWIAISNSTSAGDATFVMPTEAFVDTLSDDDPQKHVIGVRLTVTDAEGATDSDTLDIVINQRPVADIQVFAGLLDRTLLDLDASTKERYNIAAVIDGPGENGNRDNEWDVMEGAYLQLDGSASTDENPSTGLPASYSWSRTLIRPADADGYNDATFENTGQRLDVGATAEAIDLNDDEDTTDAGESVMVLPKDVDPGSPVTLFYTLTVTDARGRTGSSIVRIVVNDTSVTPDVSIELGNRLSAGIPGRGLSDSSIAQKDTPPQPTVGQFTGVENQFLVAAGSTVQLAATVKVNNMVQTTGYSYRWTGAVQVAATDSDATLAVNEPAEARIRVPANAADGDTIDVSVTVTDSARRSSVTTPIQLLVGKNTPPTADGVDANNADKDAPPMPSLLVHSVTDGFQSEEDGSTVTLRGVGNDADGDSIITAWTLREAPDPDAFNAAVAAWVENGTALPAEQQRALLDLREPKEPLFELSGALTDTVSFEVPNLENGESKGTFLVFTVVDSNGAFDAQLVYVHIKADDDVPNADAGADQQVEPGSFVRLNGSASSDPDTGDDISHRWEYVGAEMDPLPGARSPLSQAEIDELDGWILDKDGSTAGGTIDYIVGDNFILKQGESSNNLKSTTSAYPYFDAPELTGFNNIKLTFRLTVADGEDLNSDGDEEDSVSNVVESVVDIDVNRDGDKDDTFLGFIERFAGNFDTDTVTITVVNRFYSGSIPGPDFCTNRSLGGPQTFAFDSDKDGVADTCALNTTRRATVA